MPLTKTGKKVKREMLKTYGSEDKAEEVFYASMNKNKPGSEKWHLGTGPRREGEVAMANAFTGRVYNLDTAGATRPSIRQSTSTGWSGSLVLLETV